MIDRLNGPGADKEPKRTPQEVCDINNAKLGRTDIEWVLRDGHPALRWKKSSLAMLNEDAARKPVMDRRGKPMSESDTFQLNKELERLGATKRYRSDGTRYDAIL